MKFRIWDNEVNDFVPVTGMMRDDGEIFIEAKPQEWAAISEYPDRFVVCFSSGMLDDNEREIFHGDIIGAKGFSPMFDDERGTYWVNWGADLQWVCPKRIDEGYGLPLAWGGWDQRVVIGNVFQNRGLVEKTIIPQQETPAGEDYGLHF